MIINKIISLIVRNSKRITNCNVLNKPSKVSKVSKSIYLKMNAFLIYYINILFIQY